MTTLLGTRVWSIAEIVALLDAADKSHVTRLSRILVRLSDTPA
jgi:hypothetical protein